MSIGLEALDIFAKRARSDIQEKYPFIWKKKLDSQSAFNPNYNYLYTLSFNHTKIPQTNPFYCFTLIPEQTNEQTSSLNTTLYFMQFLNWAVYYLDAIIQGFNSLPKNRPAVADLKETEEWTELIADMIIDVTSEENNKQKYRTKELESLSLKTFKRNSFPIKPPFFLKLCRFFARAWFDENFQTEENSVNTIEFAHYVSNYIESSISKKEKYNGKRYDGNNENNKKEVPKIFTKNNKFEYRYNSFQIQLEKHDNSLNNQYSSYSISITQYSSHTFYLMARLFQNRYKSSL